jgi:enamine deaminase RidA (YjgF/YER057c/UK114 family)
MADKTVQDGLHVIRVPQGGRKQVHITAQATAGDCPRTVAQAVAAALRDEEAHVVSLKVFGSPRVADATAGAVREAIGGGEWPVTAVGGAGFLDGAACQMQVHAISGIAVEAVRLRDRLVGVAFEDDAARYCVLGDVGPRDGARSRPEQAHEVLETMEAGLAAAGMDFTHVVRTWFYLDDILSWYGPFNDVRTGFFAERRVLDGVVPASTGIGMVGRACWPLAGRMPTPPSAALFADLLAMRPKRAEVRICSVASPLQCCAREYGSSFSRAVEVSLSGVRRLYVSGTASIDAAGQTVHAGDARRQVAKTMEAVQAILGSRGMGWSDVVSGVAYFKRSQDAPVLAAYLRERGLPALPLALACGEVCRDELVFELEVEAWRAGS